MSQTTTQVLIILGITSIMLVLGLGCFFIYLYLIKPLYYTMFRKDDIAKIKQIALENKDKEVMIEKLVENKYTDKMLVNIALSQKSKGEKHGQSIFGKNRRRNKTNLGEQQKQEGTRNEGTGTNRDEGRNRDTKDDSESKGQWRI